MNLKEFKAALQDATRTALATTFAVWLGLGIDIWSLDTEALKALSAAGIAAGVQVLLRYLQAGGEYGVAAKK
jgi:hypothetical protein